nr:hypothetical protein TetV2_00134 [Oceanusvirus sp.]
MISVGVTMSTYPEEQGTSVTDPGMDFASLSRIFFSLAFRGRAFPEFVAAAAADGAEEEEEE